LRLKRAGALFAALALVGGTAGFASGCSESDEVLNQAGKAQYILELRALVKLVQRESQVAAKLLSVDSLAEAAPVIGEAVETFDELVARLEEIEPPDEVAAVHDRLTAALASASDLLTDAKRAVEGNDLAALLLLAPQLSDFRERFRTIVDDYDSQGYQLIGARPEPAQP
jgi:hypothetical protein